MTEMQRSGIEVILAFADNVWGLFLYTALHRKPRMTDMERSGMEVISWLRSDPGRGDACVLRSH